MKLVSRGEMETVFEWKEAGTHWIIKHFLYHYDEVLYFVQGERLKAVVSARDVFNYLEGRSGGVLNGEFTRISQADPEDLRMARAFFEAHPTIHELPVTDCGGRFVGIMKSGGNNTERKWAEIRLRIKGLYYGLPRYYEEMSERFMSHFKGRVFLIDLPDDERVLQRLGTDREREAFRKKHAVPPLEQLRRMTEQEERDYWGPLYEPGISAKFAEEFSGIKAWQKNGCKLYENGPGSRYITFDGGKRNVAGKAEKPDRSLYLVGPCTVFGAYVADGQTIGDYLQEMLNRDGCPVRVVNFGSLGLYYEFQYLLTEAMGEDDMVVMASQNKTLIRLMGRYGNACCLGDYSDIFDGVSHPVSCVLDTFRHVNYRVSKEMARRLYGSIRPWLLPAGKKTDRAAACPIQDYFISWDIVSYYKEFALDHHLSGLGGRVGAAVMNCNPFTKGHRHLIEYAAGQVDTMIVFVVEEDASAFRFQDRLEMVRLGTRDLGNVRVVPSGKYNISKSTFAQYFEKDKEIRSADSMEYDLRIFCEVIARCMNIRCRFAGEEPADVVTRRYNEAMRRILPQYGMEFCQIPRLKTCEDEYVSATTVRRLLGQGDWEAVSAFLPETTTEYLKRRERT